MALSITRTLVPHQGYMWQCKLCEETFHMRHEADKHANMWLKRCPGRSYS
jgi:hypothetical protein